MKELVGIMLLFSALGVCVSQEHAPAIGQCKADIILWNTQAKVGEITSRLPASELWVRIHEVINCDLRYNFVNENDSVFRPLVMGLQDAYNTEILRRTFASLKRKGLLEESRRRSRAKLVTEPRGITISVTRTASDTQLRGEEK